MLTKGAATLLIESWLRRRFRFRCGKVRILFRRSTARVEVITPMHRPAPGREQQKKSRRNATKAGFHVGMIAGPRTDWNREEYDQFSQRFHLVSVLIVLRLK